MSARERLFWPVIALSFVSVTANVLLLKQMALRGDGKGFVEFRPVDFNGPSGSNAFPYIVSGRGNAFENDRRRQQAKFVLDEHGVASRFERGVLMVPEDVWEDKGLMAIVTSRAKDPDWLRAHGYKGDLSEFHRDARDNDVEKRVNEYWQMVADGVQPGDRDSGGRGLDR